jgi:hypothetical protein
LYHQGIVASHECILVDYHCTTKETLSPNIVTNRRILYPRLTASSEFGADPVSRELLGVLDGTIGTRARGTYVMIDRSSCSRLLTPKTKYEWSGTHAREKDASHEYACIQDPTRSTEKISDNIIPVREIYDRASSPLTG